MIEMIEGLPTNVLGVVVRGRVTQRDCSDVLIPALEKARTWHHRLRLYYEIRSRYPGAAWEEIALGIGYGPMWERVALVSDVAWLRHTVQALRLLIPGEIRMFTTSQTPEGLAWIADAKWRRRRPVSMFAAGAADAGGRAFMPAPQFLHQAP